MFNNNSSFLKIKKAQGIYSLCLCSLLLMAFPGGAIAQTEIQNRLNRVENDINTLNRAVYKGEKPPQQLFNSQQNASATQAAAQMEVRIQQMETQIRELTGKIEEQLYTINQLKQDMASLESGSESVADTYEPPKPRATLNPMGQAEPKKSPLGFDLSAQEPKGMQTASPIRSTTDATALYESAYTNLKNDKVDDARQEFEDFLRKHPKHVLSANAKYWLGETYYVEGDFNKAARNFAQGFQSFPESAKSPDMLLKLGLSLANLDKTQEACIALSQLPVKFKAGPQNILDRGVNEMNRLGCNS